jgi:thioesterase domain-containing protein
MTGRNFAAIQPRGLEERARADHTVTAAARRNIAALRALQPRGPYAIAGYSYGGVVAFEMACQLRAAREVVAQLVILDTNAPGGAGLEPSASDAPPGPEVSAWHAARAAAAHAKERMALATAGLVPRRGYRQHDLFFRLNGRMARRYTPATTFDGPALVVRSDAFAEPAPATDGRPSRPLHPLTDLGWSEHVSGPVTTVEMPVDHWSLLRKPAVDVIAGHIAAALAAGTTARS